jgi:hypothetical protein
LRDPAGKKWKNQQAGLLEKLYTILERQILDIPFFQQIAIRAKKKPSKFFALLRTGGQLTVFTIRIGWFFASLFCPHFLYLGGRGYFIY